MSNEQNTIFDGNLTFSLDKEQLEELFSQFGTILEVNMPTNRETGKPRGFAFIKFESKQAAQAALKMDGQDCSGRSMRVNLAHGKNEGGRGGEGRGDSRGGRSSQGQGRY